MRRGRRVARVVVAVGLVAHVAGCGGVVSFEADSGPQPIVDGVYATTTVVTDDSCSPALEVRSPASAAVVAVAGKDGPRWVRLPALDFVTMEAPWVGDAYAATFEGEVVACPPGAWMSITLEATPMRGRAFSADVELVYTGLAGCDASTPAWPLPDGDCTVRLTTTFELVEACEAPCTVAEGAASCECSHLGR